MRPAVARLLEVLGQPPVAWPVAASREPRARGRVTAWVDQNSLIVTRGRSEYQVILLRKARGVYYLVPGDGRQGSVVPEDVAYREALAAGATDQDWTDAFPQVEMPFTAAQHQVMVPLGALCEIRVGMPDADLWLWRRNSEDLVGKPVREYNPQHIGIKVVRTDLLLPAYLYYALEHLWMQGAWKSLSSGTTRLVSIRVADVQRVPVGPMTIEIPDQMEEGGPVERTAAQPEDPLWDLDFDHYSWRWADVPIQNVYVASPKHNQMHEDVIQDNVDRMMDGEAPTAVIGFVSRSKPYSRPPAADDYWIPLGDPDDVGPYGYVDDGMHRAEAAKRAGFPFLRIMEQLGRTWDVDGLANGNAAEEEDGLEETAASVLQADDAGAEQPEFDFGRWPANLVRAVRSLGYDSPSEARIRGVRTAADGDQAFGAAAFVQGGELVGYHVTDDAAGLVAFLEAGGDVLRGRAEDKFGDLGTGFYVSAVPQLWTGRAPGKYDFLKSLTDEQRRALADAIRRDWKISDPGYISRFEREHALRSLERFEANPDEHIVYLADQPYNVAFWKKDFLEPLGIGPGRGPQTVEVRFTGRYVEIDGGLVDYGLPDALRAAGYHGAFTPNGFASVAQLVIWDSSAVRSARAVDLKLGAAPPPADETSFEDYIAGMRRERQDAYDAFVPLFRPHLEFKSERHKFRESYRAFVAQDPSKPGKWRVQEFDASGFTGHQESGSVEEARDLLFDHLWGGRDDRVVPDAGALSRATGTPEWEQGMEHSQRVRDWIERGIPMKYARGRTPATRAQAASWLLGAAA